MSDSTKSRFQKARMGFAVLCMAVFLVIALVLYMKMSVNSNQQSIPLAGASIQEPAPVGMAANILKATREIGANRIGLCRGDEISKTYGISRDIYLNGNVVLKAQDVPCTYCSGAVLEVYMLALQKTQEVQPGYAVARLNQSNFSDFRRKFYGTDGNRQTLVRALIEYGLGEKISSPENARPGDLIQFWRNNGSGHSVVFLGLVRNENGIPAGLRFWSSQTGSGGFGISEEYFGTSGKSIILDQVYIVRPSSS